MSKQTELCPETIALLGDAGPVPVDYRRQVAEVKRVLERWHVDPEFRQAPCTDAALRDLGLSLTAADVVPLLGNEGPPEGPPMSVAGARYKAFLEEKRAYRRQYRDQSEASSPAPAAWRRRQIQRCIYELGPAHADTIVHAPAVFELSSGCSVGCWFCGIDAPRLTGLFSYTEANASLWRGTLSVLRDVLGKGAGQAFCYWATDPMDNPDYERFLVDFHQVLGRFPQTTTAMPTRSLERTRRLLALSRSHGCVMDRFSILTVKMLRQLHEHFTPEELLTVDCVPLNKESTELYKKARAGRARTSTASRQTELMSAQSDMSIACVSGFLFNMVERRVRLITPCQASDRWPLGYWVLAEATFDQAEDLRHVLQDMVDRHMKATLTVDDDVRLLRGLSIMDETDKSLLTIRGTTVRLSTRPGLSGLVSRLHTGGRAGDLATELERDGVPLEQTMRWILDLFEAGLLDEEPVAG